MAGVDMPTVSQLMGHRTIQMTIRYAHLAPDHQQSAVDRLVLKRAMAILKGRSASRTATALRRGA
jgi:integrase